MWNSWGPSPRMPTLRIPTTQSPMPAFFFLGRHETPQSLSPHTIESPGWRTPWPPTSQQSPMPTVGLLERPETPGHFSGRSSIEQQNPIPLNQLLRNILELDSKFRKSDPLDNPPKSQSFRPQHLVHSMLFTPGLTHNQTNISDVVDAGWNNPNIWPIIPLLNSRKDPALTGINRELQSGEIQRIWKFRNPYRYIDLPAVDAQSPTAYSNSPNDVNLVESSPLLLLLPIPFPEDRELWVKFGGDTALGWNTLKPSVDRFIHHDTWGSDHSLTVSWSPSSPEVDLNGWRGGRTFKLLFDRLKEQRMEIDPGRTALALFKSISINVPEKFEETDVVPITGFERTLEEQIVIDADKIDLGSASNLKELILQGSHLYFAEKLLLPVDQLTLLSITCCQISVNDALALLQTCSRLKDFHLETVHDREHCELGDRLYLESDVRLGSMLRKLTMTSSADISRILEALSWESGPRITLNILDDGAARRTIGSLPSTSRIPRDAFLTLKGNFIQRDKQLLRRNIPNVIFCP